MPKKITSQSPVVRPAVPERVYGDMKLSWLKVTPKWGGLALSMRLVNYDQESGELDPEGQSYTLNIDNLDSLLEESPKLGQAWDILIDCLSEQYEASSLDEKAENEEDPDKKAALLARRKDVLNKIREQLK